MAVDTQLSFLGALYDILTTDASLKAAMGGTVRLYPVQATPDTVMPYMVHRLDISGGEPFPLRDGTYVIDIFSDSATIDEITAIRRLVIGLVDERIVTTADIQSARLWLQTDGFVQELEEGVWHYVLQLNVRWYRKGEAAAILARGG